MKLKRMNDRGNLGVKILLWVTVSYMAGHILYGWYRL